MSAFLQSGRFYPGETPNFRVRFRPKAVSRQTKNPRRKAGVSWSIERFVWLTFQDVLLWRRDEAMRICEINAADNDA